MRLARNREHRLVRSVAQELARPTLREMHTRMSVRNSPQQTVAIDGDRALRSSMGPRRSDERTR
jgi:hypothetical protein